MTRHTYQIKPTVTGDCDAIMFAAFQGELSAFDYRTTTVQVLSCGGFLDAPDFLPSGKVQENDGNIRICTVDRPGRYTDAQLAKWQAEMDEMLGMAS